MQDILVQVAITACAIISSNPLSSLVPQQAGAQIITSFLPGSLKQGRVHILTDRIAELNGGTLGNL